MTTTTIDRTETELRAAARRRGLTMRELAAKMGVSPGYLSEIGTGHRPMTPKMRERIASVLGEAPGQGIVHSHASVVNGESSYIRERARERGMSMRDLADRVGVSHGYITKVARGQKNMGVKVQARVESALEAPATVAAAQCATVNFQAVWDRMNAHEISQNEVARRAGISSAHLSNIISDKANPSPGVLKRLHAVLFQRSKAEERVMPAEVKVLAWRKGERSGMVVRDDGGKTTRIGGRVPWGASVNYAYRSGYDSRGQVYVTHVVDEGCSGLLTQPEAGAD